MKTSKDFSEIQEAAQLLSAILREEAETPAEKSAPAPEVKPEAAPPPAARPIAAEKGAFRGDQLENAIELMCRRGNFSGAVVADENGLPLAVFNSPVGTDAIAAFTSVLGAALEKASRLLEQHGADNISMDINYADKVVLRRFTVSELTYFLMVICPQNVDERSEIELSIEQIVSILG